jgi:cytochrome c oxidase subunit 2
MKELFPLPIDASQHGPAIDQMIIITHWLMAVLFVVWAIYFVYVLIRFRAKRQPQADYVGVKSHASNYLEVAVALFEGVLLIGFAIPVWSNVVTTFPKESDALVVHVVAEQFAWNVHYPGPDGKFGRREISLVTAENPLGLDRQDPDAKDDITTINQLTLPVGRNILVYLTSKDVIHSFGIPLLRVKQDAIPGQQIPVWFRATMTNDQIRDQLVRHVVIPSGETPRELLTMVAYENYAASDGSPIVSKGDPFTEDIAQKLRDAGIKDVVATRDTPMEIACAQLCGLGHYRMRGTVTIMTDEGYQAWLNEEASYLE